MADAIVFEIDCDAALYGKVNETLGLVPETRGGDWPIGLVTHVAAAAGDAVMVFEVWESRAQQETWMGTLGPALEKVGVPAPRRMEWLGVLGQYSR